NFGSAVGPLAAAFIVLPRGQHGLAWFAIAAVAGIILLTGLAHWYQSNGHAVRPTNKVPARHPTLSRAQISGAMEILIALQCPPQELNLTNTATSWLPAEGLLKVPDPPLSRQGKLSTNSQTSVCPCKNSRVLPGKRVLDITKGFDGSAACASGK